MSQTFKEILATLPEVDHLDRIELHNANGELVDTIPNAPGKQGSLRVYNALFHQFGPKLTPESAELGLTIFSEHTADAKAHPGKHPNIDRLFNADAESPLSILLIKRNSE